MRTIRNVVFALLCAMTLLMPVPAKAMSYSATYWYTDISGGHHYQATSDSLNCDDAWWWAINFCDQRGGILVEYFCTGYTNGFSFVCLGGSIE